MSGIVALLDLRGAPVDRELLHAMTAMQRFRGPDGEGEWASAAVGLGHTLHKTTQEAEHEQQPASFEGRFFITADARVDAREDLCDKLRGRGFEASLSLPDCQLLLLAYAAWGERCFEHLLGDFSFALWDAPNQKLVCAVDHLGVRPFFYAARGNLFAGSSDLGALRLHPAVRDTLNEQSVGDFLTLGVYSSRAATIYEDISRIPPAHYLIAECGGVRLQPYFDLPQITEKHFRNEDDCLEQLKDLLGKAVRDRLRTPRVAVSLSGGVDSALITQIAQRELRKTFPSHRLEGFTQVYDSLIPHDERHYAGLVGQSLGVPVHFFPMDGGDFFDGIGRNSDAQPCGARVAGPYLDLRETIAGEFSVILTGYDGDTLLWAALRMHWKERLEQGRFRALARELAWYIKHERALPPVGFRTALSQRRGQATPAFPSWFRADFARRGELESRWTQWYAPEQVVSSRTSAPLLTSPEWGDLFDDWQPGERTALLEARHPLADLRVVLFTRNLPAVPWCVNKYALRRCLDGLPKAISTRPKTPLAGDPDHARLKLRPLKLPAPESWTPGLDAFVDTTRVMAATTGEPSGIDTALLAVCFGLWLNARDRGAQRGAS